MERSEFDKLITTEFSTLGIDITDKEKEMFFDYMNNLIEWNKKINLTAIKEERDIIIKHFLDSVIILSEIRAYKVLDLGSGAGFPGIPMKIMNKELEMCLIDSVNKKVNFINDTISKLKLNNVRAIHTRAEELAHDKNYRESFDVAVSRAVANMSTLVEYMLPFVKNGGKCICMKGPNVEAELEESKNAIKKLGGKIDEVKYYNIEENERCLVIISKEKSTEQIYPRNQGKPLKDPIK